MKTVLCFGDSNTWGFIPGTDAKRYPWPQRLCGIVQEKLGDDWRVVEEGLNGRTTIFDDPMEPDRNGKLALPMLLKTHAPLDVVTVMLGTNDLKHLFSLEPKDIALGAATLVQLIQSSGPIPGILLISPPHVSDEAAMAPKFDGAIEKSRGLAEAYRRVADDLGCAFLDAAPLCASPVPDGVHLDPDSIRCLAEAMAKQIATLP